jgi:hypothetical protein
LRHNDRNETFLCALKDEAAARAALVKASAPFGTALAAEGDEMRVALKA